MNEVFLFGKISSNIKFDFIINSKKNISISQFTIETQKNQIIKIKAYNNLADLCYRKFKKDNIVFIYGKLRKNCVEINTIKNL